MTLLKRGAFVRAVQVLDPQNSIVIARAASGPNLQIVPLP
jgi:hypothetical protein